MDFKLNFEKTRDEANNNWNKIYRYLAPELNSAIEANQKHVSCPMHTGNDGDAFRMFPDWNYVGGCVCNTCGTYSDGFKLLMELKSWTYYEVMQKVQETLNSTSNKIKNIYPIQKKKGLKKKLRI